MCPYKMGITLYSKAKISYFNLMAYDSINKLTLF